MKAIRYVGRVVGGVGVRAGLNDPNTLTVRDSFDRDHLGLEVPGADIVLLDAVQVDKLRQQFHEWLHERCQTPGGFHRWEVL